MAVFIEPFRLLTYCAVGKHVVSFITHELYFMALKQFMERLHKYEKHLVLLK